MGLWNTHAERTGVALAGGAVLLVGGSVAASGLRAGYPVLGGQAIRYAAAGLLLAGWARLRHHRLPRPAGREWCWLAGLAAVGLAGCSVLLIMATRARQPGWGRRRDRGGAVDHHDRRPGRGRPPAVPAGP